VGVLAAYKARVTTTPHPIPELDKLASRASADITRALWEAYEIGREDMRRELMALLSPSRNDAPPPGPLYDTNASEPRAKAPPGTVRPAILSMIELSSGVTTEHIIRTTGFKENSVRGTLSTLAKELRIERRGNEWFVKKIKASDGEPTEASKSSDSGLDPLVRETADHDR
jgi:hypothetical protein